MAVDIGLRLAVRIDRSLAGPYTEEDTVSPLPGSS